MSAPRNNRCKYPIWRAARVGSRLSPRFSLLSIPRSYLPHLPCLFASLCDFLSQVIQIPDGPDASPPVAIAHGRSAGWQRYAIWIARRDGSVAALCPVVPENAKIDSEELVSGPGRNKDKGCLFCAPGLS